MGQDVEKLGFQNGKPGNVAHQAKSHLEVTDLFEEQV